MSCAHTLDVSVLLDGELPGADTPALVAHLLSCPACTAFFQRAHALEAAVLLAAAEGDAAGDDSPAPPPAVWERIARATAEVESSAPRRRSRALPSWAAAAVAAALLALGGLVGWQVAARTGPTATALERLPTREVVTLAALGPTAAQMDEERFVVLARELLAADPRYHDAMAGVLAVARSSSSREGSTAESAWRGEELRDLAEEPARLH